MIKQEVLRTLEENRGTRFSGGALGRQLGVSRAAIWKAIEALRADGLDISAVPGGGYQLAAHDDSLTAEGIRQLLQTEALGRDLMVRPEVESTNTLLKQQYTARDEGFTLIAARQTAGRGRLGRSFHSPPGDGLYMSVLLRPKLTLEQFGFLTIAAAVAVCRAIHATCGFAPRIKWVNDILMDDKKLCGILTEAAIEGETGTIEYAVVGIGVNVRLDRSTLPPALLPIAGALADHTQQPPRRAALAAAILYELEQAYAALQQGHTAALLDSYRSRLCWLGQTVRVLAPSGAYEAVCLDVNAQGNLLVARENGEIITLSAGEISIHL